MNGQEALIERQMAQVLRIKRAREEAARRALEAAIQVEERRRTIRDEARAHRDQCSDSARDYFRKRFEDQSDIENFRAFFDSVAAGNLMAKRAVSRADSVLKRVTKNHEKASTRRVEASRDLFSITRSVEAFEDLADDQKRLTSAANDIVEEDDLSEHAGTRRADAVF